MFNDNQPGGRDLIGHPAVQAWSAGPLFPAVIAVVEVYDDQPYRMVFDCVALEMKKVLQPLDERLRYRAYELTYPGRESAMYATREDAEAVARYYLEIAKHAEASSYGAQVAERAERQKADIYARVLGDAWPSTWPKDPGFAAWDLRVKAAA